ncbi:hypothetical protein PENSPDRAFT_459195 [Peniophora sp. CONT]|nr:hypothetical protein PENSPDRAFT_459195 [Peniophora sp. CONT]
MSGNTTVSQAQAAVNDLRLIADARVFPVLLETTLFAFFTVLTIYFVWQRWNHYTHKPLVKPMLSLAMCLYILAAASWAIDIRILWKEMYVLLPARLAASASSKFDPTLTNSNGAPLFAQAVLLRLIWFISDCISLWRAYAILGRPRWLWVLSVTILFLEAGVYILDIVLISATRLPNPPASLTRLIQEHSSPVTLVQTLATSFTAAVLAVSTLLIGYKSWIHRLEIRDYVREYEFSRSLAMLAILVESGVVYTSVWVIYAIYNDLPSLDSSFGFYWSTFYMAPLSAMYPTLVVVIVTIRRSVLEYTLNSSSLPTDIAVALGDLEGPNMTGGSDNTMAGPSDAAEDEKRMSKETHRTEIVSQVAPCGDMV